MACDIMIDASIGDGCSNGQGGVSEFYPFPFLKDAFTVVAGEATDMNVALTEAFKFVLTPGDANTLEQPSIADHKTGTTVCTQTLNAQLTGYTAAGNDALHKFEVGKSSGVLKDRSGVYHWLAADEGFNNVTVNPVTGGARTDFTGNNIICVAETKKVAPILSSTAVTAFLAIVTEPI